MPYGVAQNGLQYCSTLTTDVPLVHWLAQWPLEQSLLDNFTASITNPSHPDGRSVFVLGQGVWNSFVFKETRQWLHQIQDALLPSVPSYFATASGERFPRLFISPDAQSEAKEELFAQKQNNIALQKFVHHLDPFLASEGYEHLAMYNMTVQDRGMDGTHSSFEATILKAMMVLNWLDALEVPLPQ